MAFSNVPAVATTGTNVMRVLGVDFKPGLVGLMRGFPGT
jgi:hypothetical protein